MARPRKQQPPKPQRRAPGTGSVGIRKDGRVYAILPSALDPKRRPVYGLARGQRFTSLAEAGAWLDAEIVRRQNPDPRSASKQERLGAYLTRWYRNNSSEWPERTALAYAVSLSRWEPIGDVMLGDLTREVVQGGLAELRRATWQRKRKDGTSTSEPRLYSRRTIDQARVLLHQALEDLIPDVLLYNPARARGRSRREADTEQPVWSADQAERFLAMAEKHEPRLALAFRLILRRALRTGETIDLKVADVDERNSTLRVDETPGVKRGTSGPTKTRIIRDVPLSADLIRRLREHRRAYPSTGEHLFTVLGKRISTGYFRERWHHIVRLAQLPRITPKDGRATCATILLDEGRPLPEVSRLLGHTNVATTAAFYSRVIKRRAEQTARLGEDLDVALERAARRDTEEAPRLLRDAESGE